MKKSTKVLCVIAGTLMAVGLCLAIIGKCLGGGPSVVQWVLNGELSFGTLDILPWKEHANIDWNEAYPICSGTVEKTELRVTQDIQKIDIQIGGARLHLVFSDEEEVCFESEEAVKYQCYAEDNVLYVRSEGSFTVGKNENEIILYMPRDRNYQSVKLEIGAGTVEIEGGLQARVLEAEIGAGTFLARSAEVERLCVEIGAGMATLSDMQAKAAELEVGMGQLIFEGDVSGNMTAECSMGSMEFTMDSEENAHDYEVDCAMGSVTLGSHSYSGIGLDKQIVNHEAGSLYELSCSMGEIKMKFR